MACSWDWARLAATWKRIAFSASNAGLAVQADVVAVGLHRQAVRLDGLRTGRPRAPGLLLLHLLGELGAKIDVFGFVAGGVGVGDIGRDQLLPGAQQRHVLFEISSDSFKHDACPKAVARAKL